MALKKQSRQTNISKMRQVLVVFIKQQQARTKSQQIEIEPTTAVERYKTKKPNASKKRNVQFLKQN